MNTSYSYLVFIRCKIKIQYFAPQLEVYFMLFKPFLNRQDQGFILIDRVTNLQILRSAADHVFQAMGEFPQIAAALHQVMIGLESENRRKYKPEVCSKERRWEP